MVFRLSHWYKKIKRMFKHDLNKAPGISQTFSEPFFKAFPLQKKEDDGNDNCKKWEDDIESITIKVISLFLRNHLKWSGVFVKKLLKCQSYIPPMDRHMCDFILTNGRSVRVLLLKDVNMAKVQLAKEPEGTGTETYCFYDYTCNDKNEIEFTEDKCDEE